jgi:putative hydrolase of HD superfamily
MRGVREPESISDHMYMASMMAWLITDPNIDRDKCIKMAFVHDLAESIVGDIVPHDPNVNAEQKHELEKAAMLKLGETLGNPAGTLLVVRVTLTSCKRIL